MKNYNIVKEAIIIIEEGKTVTLPVNGVSMFPLIKGGEDSITLEKHDNYCIFDIVLAWVNNDHFVIHRIIKKKNNIATLMGDGNIGQIEKCNISDIKALATHIVDKKGNRIVLNRWYYKLYAVIWICLYPIRRYLLTFCKRFMS